MRSPRAVVLAEGERRERVEVLRRRDGRAIPAAEVERIYSTPELLALERWIIDYALERRGARMGVATPRTLERARAPSLVG